MCAAMFLLCAVLATEKQNKKANIPPISSALDARRFDPKNEKKKNIPQLSGLAVEVELGEIQH